MAFRYKKSRIANAGRELMDFTITDSQVLSVGESVKLVSGKVSTGGAGGDILGVVAGFVKADGSPVTDNGAGGRFTNTYTAGSSNTVKAKVDVSKLSIYSAPADATLGTTTGSNLAGYLLDQTAASDTLDEDTAAATTAQWFSWGPDPDPTAPSNSLLVSIFEHQSDKPVV
jgi:hypothetical protein